MRASVTALCECGAELLAVAVHGAGHAGVSILIGADPLKRVTITPILSGEGSTLHFQADQDSRNKTVKLGTSASESPLARVLLHGIPLGRPFVPVDVHTGGGRV